MKEKLDISKLRETMGKALSNQLFLSRLIGKAVDMIIAIGVASVLYPAGPLAAFLYILVCDGLHNGQSIGKRLTGIYVMSTVSQKPATFKDSIMRNFPIALTLLFLLISLWGWILWVIIGLPVLVIEIYLMKTVENQERLGDTVADTRVCELSSQS